MVRRGNMVRLNVKRGTVALLLLWLADRRLYSRFRMLIFPQHKRIALTNRGRATTSDLLTLAGAVRQGVYDAFGIVLVNEPVLIGCELPPLAHPR